MRKATCRFEIDQLKGNGARNLIAFDLSEDNQENEFRQVKKRKRSHETAKCQESNLRKVKKPRKLKKPHSFVPAATIVETNRITLTLPIYTLSEGNSYEKWQDKHARHEMQKKYIKMALTQFRGHIPLPCTVTLTRIAPRELDTHDNLPMSQKWITDSICDFLIPGMKPGRADNDRRIKIMFSQEKSKDYGVKIVFQF